MRLLVALSCLVLLLLPAHTYADTLPIPKSSYPPHSSHFAFAQFTNDDWDCQWASSCEDGSPLFHSGPGAYDWGRVAGWQQGAVTITTPHHRLTWAMTGNLFDSPGDTQGVALDFVQTMQVDGFTDAKNQPDILPAGDIGGSDLLVYKTKGRSFYVVVAFWGTAEIEGGAIYRAKGTQSEARRYLVRQARAALAYEIDQIGTAS